MELCLHSSLEQPSSLSWPNTPVHGHPSLKEACLWSLCESGVSEVLHFAAYDKVVVSR